MITLTYTMLSLLPMLACLMACMTLLPLLVALHARRVEKPTDAHAHLDSWNEVLACLDAVAPMRRMRTMARPVTWGCIPYVYPRTMRRGRNVARRVPSSLEYERPTSGCPPDMV